MLLLGCWFLISALICPGLWLRVVYWDELNWIKSMEAERTIPQHLHKNVWLIVCVGWRVVVCSLEPSMSLLR